MNAKEHILQLIRDTDDVERIKQLAKAYTQIVMAETQERMTDYTVEIGDPFPADDTLN